MILPAIEGCPAKLGVSTLRLNRKSILSPFKYNETPGI